MKFCLILCPPHWRVLYPCSPPQRAVGTALYQQHRPLWCLLGPWSEPGSEGLGIMNPWVVCVSMCLCVYLYVCLYVSLCVLVCLWLAIHVFMCLCVGLYVSACVFPCVCVSVCVLVAGVYVCVTVCLECICVCLAVSMYSSRSITWADPQRERLTGPCVHSSRLLGSKVSSWALPCSSGGPPHQTSPHCPPACLCMEKRWGGGADPWRTVTTALCESCACPPIKALIRSHIQMQKYHLGETEIQTEVCYWLVSGTEEIRSWITWLDSTRYVFWRRPGPPGTWVLRNPQSTGCWSVLAFSLSTLSFFRKIKAWGFLRCVFWSPRVASSGLWPLLSKELHLRAQKGPHLCSSCLGMFNISWTRGPTLLCPTLSIFTGSYKLGSWSWAPSEMLMRKEGYPRSFTFFPYQIHKQILRPFPSNWFLLPSISLPSHSPHPRPSYWSWAQE